MHRGERTAETLKTSCPVDGQGAPRAMGANFQRALLFGLQVPVVTLIAYQLWTKEFPLLVYTISAALLGLLLAVSLRMRGNDTTFLFGQILFVSIILMNVYYLATHYAVLPWGDPYGQYYVLSTSVEQGHVPLTPEGSFLPERYLYYGWPGLQIVGSVISQVLSLEPFAVAMILPWAFFLVRFIFVYLLLREVLSDLGFGPGVIGLALLINMMSPYGGGGEGVPPIFKYQDMAILFTAMIFFLAYKRLRKGQAATSLVIFPTLAALVVTHHYTSFLAVLYLLTLAFTFSAASGLDVLLRRRGATLGTNSAMPFVNIGIVAAALVFLWWSEVATNIFPFISNSWLRIVETIRLGRYAPSTFGGGYPIPSPDWALAVLLMRNMAIFGGAALGFALILARSWPSRRTRLFVVGSVLTMASPLLVDAAFASTGPPYRVLVVFMPFIALCAGVFFGQLTRWLSKPRVLSAVLMPGVAALIVFALAIGQGANQWVPRHLYDPSVTAAAAGEHPRDWRRLKEFVDDRIVLNNVATVITDERYATELMLPLDQWHKIEVVDSREAELRNPYLVVAFRKLRTDSYMTRILTDLPRPGYNAAIFIDGLNRTSDHVYSDGEFDLWRR